MAKKSPTAHWRKSLKNFPSRPATPVWRKFSSAPPAKPAHPTRRRCCRSNANDRSWFNLLFWWGERPRQPARQQPRPTKPAHCQMIPALFYLQWQSFRNRLVTRFKRLKQPKYLFGAIVGGLYFYFYFFHYLFHQGYASGGRHAATVAIPPEYLVLAESLAALALLVIVLLAWIIPHERAALTFTEAEVAFLFPAPVTRRTLIHFKLIRSQLRILFSALLLTFFSRRFGGHV